MRGHGQHFLVSILYELERIECYGSKEIRNISDYCLMFNVKVHKIYLMTLILSQYRTLT